MADLRELSIKFPIRFSDQAQKDLYETCMAYKELAERRGAENERLRVLVKLLFACIQQGEDEYGSDWSCSGCDYCDSCDGLIDARTKAIELGVEVTA